MGKNWNLIIILIMNALASSIYSIIAPYIPAEASKHGLSPTLIGVLIAGYSFSSLLVSLTIGKYIGIIGRERVLFIGCFLESIAMLGLGIISNSSSPAMFLLVGLLCRVLQGTGAGCIATSTLAIIANQHFSNIQEILGFLQIADAIGFMLGPIGASVLYALGGFSTIFLVYSFIMIASVVILSFFIEKSEYSPKKPGNFSSLQLLKERKILLYLMIALSASTSISFITPTFSLHLESYGISEAMFGVIFAIPTFSFVATALLMKKFHFPMRNIAIVGLSVIIVSNIIIGPWKYSYLPHVVAICILGVFLIGIGLCLCNLTALPMIIQISQERFAMHDKEVVSDVASGFSISATFFAGMYSPPLSGILRDSFGFENAQAILAGYLAVVLIVFFTYTSETKKLQKNTLLIELTEN